MKIISSLAFMVYAAYIWIADYRERKEVMKRRAARLAAANQRVHDAEIAELRARQAVLTERFDGLEDK